MKRIVLFWLFMITVPLLAKSSLLSHVDVGIGAYVFNQQPIALMTDMLEKEFEKHNNYESFHIGFNYKIQNAPIHISFDLITGLTEFRGVHSQIFASQEAFNTEFSRFSLGRLYTFQDPSQVFDGLSPLLISYAFSARLTEARIGLKKYWDIGTHAALFFGGGIATYNFFFDNRLSHQDPSLNTEIYHEFEEQATQIGVYATAGISVQVLKNIFVSAAYSRSTGGAFRFEKNNNS